MTDSAMSWENGAPFFARLPLLLPAVRSPRQENMNVSRREKCARITRRTMGAHDCEAARRAPDRDGHYDPDRSRALGEVIPGPEQSLVEMSKKTRRVIVLQRG
jgi:hypothetical protein